MPTHKKIKFSTLCSVLITSVSLLSIIMVGTMWIYYEYALYANEAAQYEQEFIQKKKDTLRNEVNRTLDYIRFKRAHAEDRLMADVKSRVLEAYSLAERIYDARKGLVPLDEIQQEVKEVLRHIRFNQSRGYYFAVRPDGVIELSADDPALEGKNIKDIQGVRGRDVFRRMAALSRSAGEGFHTYTWSKPGSQGNDFRKSIFVKYFEPFNWLIGTGEYLDEIEKEIQDEVIERIENIQFAADGYIFAGKLDGVSVAGPMKGRNMLDVTDQNGIKIVRELIKVAQLGGGFVEYVMPGFNGVKNAPKLSYATIIEDWEWYIGGGMYIGDVYDTLHVEKRKLQERIRGYLVNIFAVLIGITCIIFSVLSYLTKRIGKNFNRFSSFFSDASSNYTKIDTENIHIAEFVDLAVSANRMIDFRTQTEKNLQDSKRWVDAILNSIQSGVLVIDADSKKIIDVNRKAPGSLARIPSKLSEKTTMGQERASRQESVCLQREGRNPLPGNRKYVMPKGKQFRSFSQRSVSICTDGITLLKILSIYLRRKNWKRSFCMRKK